MSCYFEMSGLIRVRDNDRVRANFRKLFILADNIQPELIKTGDDLTITFDGGDHLRDDQAVQLAEMLHLFNDDATEPALIQTRYDDEPAEIWVGEVKAVEEAQQQRRLEIVRNQWRALTPEQRDQLIADDTTEIGGLTRKAVQEGLQMLQQVQDLRDRQLLMATPEGRAVVRAEHDRDQLRKALDELVQLAAHYAKCLNHYDGGARDITTTAAWLARLVELKKIDPLSTTGV